MSPKGYLCLMLHAHLPFVRHPEQTHFLEEHWLYEAITETYIPLIEMFHELMEEDVPFRLTMSLTPSLVSMLKDPLLQDRYISHIDKLILLSQKEIERTRFEPQFCELARLYHRQFTQSKAVFLQWDKDLVKAFKSYQDAGCLEIVTCAATHGYLPILNINSSSVRAQVNIAVDHYQENFGCAPQGMWLPECGYTPGIETVLKKSGIRYFFVENHGLLNADPQPHYGLYAPVYTPSGVAAFGRDSESSKQVWSSKEGYPGDADYQEYYRDIGYELDYDYIKPFIHPEGFRMNTGMKYWRITGDTEYKEVYHPRWAREKAQIHAAHFCYHRQRQIENLMKHMDRAPMIVAPYDAELFGHWWTEGPMFLNFLIRKIAEDPQSLSMATPSDYLKRYPTNQIALPAASSWGYKGYGEYWLNEKNDWIYRHIHKAGYRMVELANKFSGIILNERETLISRALHQAARELLLAESSDWPFIMKTGHMTAYAEKRINNHIGRFNKIYNDILNATVDEAWLAETESRDNIFADLKCARYYLNENTAQGNYKDKEEFISSNR